MNLAATTVRHRTTLRLLLATGAMLAATLGATSAWCFDSAGYQSRLKTTLSEVSGKSVSDCDATLARLTEMIELGKVGAQEYASRQPKFAKLMDTAIANADAMRGLTDGEIEDQWGENGNSGDAVGVPLKALGQFDETRNYLELMVGPAHAYIFIKKWQTTHKPQLLAKAADELNELAEHAKPIR
jgi:hypothetical protein